MTQDDLDRRFSALMTGVIRTADPGDEVDRTTISEAHLGLQQAEMRSALRRQNRRQAFASAKAPVDAAMPRREPIAAVATPSESKPKATQRGASRDGPSGLSGPDDEHLPLEPLPVGFGVASEKPSRHLQRRAAAMRPA